jgi:hypothetical protein
VSKWARREVRMKGEEAEAVEEEGVREMVREKGEVKERAAAVVV